jgi:hypothetical protein
MFGWMLQWYVNVPAVWNVMEKLPPGAIAPELHALVSEVDVCVIVSLFTQLTLPPRVTLIGFGAYAFVVSVREPDTIDTVEPDGDGDGDGVGVGVGDGLVGDELWPHPAMATNNGMMRISRVGIWTCAPVRRSDVASSLPSTHAAFRANFVGKELQTTYEFHDAFTARVTLRRWTRHIYTAGRSVTG